MTKKEGPLWAADGVQVDAAIVGFCRGDDAKLDLDLLYEDLIASRAHVRGLGQAGVLDDDEVNTLVTHLDALIDAHAQGAFSLEDDDEDGHSAIERALIERAGDVGKKVHTGRSRNDQVLVATRLWLKGRLMTIARHTLQAARVCLERAAEPAVVMPGYTHLQQAVPSTSAFWFAGHAESLLEDLEAVFGALAVIDSCPLGTAAGYGVNIDLARAWVQKELGFGRVQLNGLAAQNSRGRFEAQALAGLLSVCSTIRRIAWDLSLFTTEEFGFVRLPARFCTGSSIMPNKKNPDVVELMRAQMAQVAGAHAELLQVTSLPSGYQRDLQLTKAPMMRGVNAALSTVALLPELMHTLEFDADRCRAALRPALLATDEATDLALSGVPFRDAYRQVKERLHALSTSSDDALAERAAESVAARLSLGGPGALALHVLDARWAEAQSRLEALGDGGAQCQ